jgi:hypothetical protein
MSGFEHMAAELLARLPTHRRTAIQAQLDKWNRLAASWVMERNRHSDWVIQHLNRIVHLRQSMEWALANGDVGDARRCVRSFERVLKRDLSRPLKVTDDVWQHAGNGNVAFPATIEAMVAEFDAREYATMMRAFYP